MSCLHVRLQKEVSDTQCEKTQDGPADKAKIEQEQLHLVAFHHGHTFLNSAIISQFGLIFQDKIGHCIRIILDNTRNNQQQGPQHCINGLKQFCADDTSIVAESIKQSSDIHITASEYIQYHNGITISYRQR